MQDEFLASLAQGRKTVEGRCCDPKYQELTPGDWLLVNRLLLLQVHSIRRYPSFRDMLVAEGLQKVLPGTPSVEEGVAVYRRFYSEEREGERGVLAIRVQRGLPGLPTASVLTPFPPAPEWTTLGQTMFDFGGARLGRGIFHGGAAPLDEGSSKEDGVFVSALEVPATRVHKGSCSLGGHSPSEAVLNSDGQAPEEPPTLLGCMEAVLQSLGPLGVCRLLGMAVTRGSVPASLPPPRSALVRSFQQLHWGPTRHARGQNRDTWKRRCDSPGAEVAPRDVCGIRGGCEVKRKEPVRDSAVSLLRDTPGSATGSGETSGGWGPESLPGACESGRDGDRGAHLCSPVAGHTQGSPCAHPGSSCSPVGATAMAKQPQGNPSAHPGSSKLTVGARALAKHSHRDLRGSFWLPLGGTEAAKNLTARQCLQRIVDTAVWLNTHCMPGGVPTFEVRTREGYGARWAADGSQFWGLLEPPMENGHEAKWRH